MRTVKVRIAVMVDEEGRWIANFWPPHDHQQLGFNRSVSDPPLCEARYWIEAELPVPELPIPEPVTVEGTVSKG